MANTTNQQVRREPSAAWGMIAEHGESLVSVLNLLLLVVPREGLRRLGSADAHGPVVGGGRLAVGRRRDRLLLLDCGRAVRLRRTWLRLRAAHVGVRAVVLARLGAVHRVPVVAVEDALVEDGAGAAQEGVLAAVVAEMVGLAAGFLVGVHAVLVGKPVAGEASLGHLSVGREISARLAAHGSCNTCLFVRSFVHLSVRDESVGAWRVCCSGVRAQWARK